MVKKRLIVNLPPNWREASAELAVGITTFLRSNSSDSGALQVSTGWYVKGPIPDPGPAQLIDIAKSIILNGVSVHDIEDGRVGDCAIGTYATVIARASGNRVQVWCMTNRYDFVFVTHAANGEPDSRELEEAERIVQSMAVENGGPPKPWWKIR
jgi:hypothetical protein